MRERETSHETVEQKKERKNAIHTYGNKRSTAEKVIGTTRCCAHLEMDYLFPTLPPHTPPLEGKTSRREGKRPVPTERQKDRTKEGIIR
mmetsp:Transcript_5887/g.13110  ORF Transcript_5887/g.13110 Transcript_5887/m.13110 type:complete len:89 (+) Transcript_5887:569-835(+)